MPHEMRGPLEVLSTSTFQLLTILYESSEQGGSLPKPWGRLIRGIRRKTNAALHPGAARSAGERTRS